MYTFLLNEKGKSKVASLLTIRTHTLSTQAMAFYLFISLLFSSSLFLVDIEQHDAKKNWKKNE